MYDRQPKYPGRVRMVPVDGQPNVYDMTMADEPTVAGDAPVTANLLQQQVAAVFGLPASATVNDMFKVLVKSGDLHVWRRFKEGYKPILSPTESTFDGNTATGPSGVTKYSKTVAVVDGTVVLSGDISTIIGPISAEKASEMVGSYFTLISETVVNYAKSSSGTIITFQVVNGYQREDISDYPVHPNRNAYQEGSDGKPAGYVLGEVKTGSFQMSLPFTPDGHGYGVSYKYGSSISVSDDGKLSISNVEGTAGIVAGDLSSTNSFKGKFILCEGSGEPSGKVGFFEKNVIYFIPADAAFSNPGNVVYVDKHQPVTGYPAIPANTAIEYLGPVGDKTKIVTGSFTPLTPGPLFVDVGFTPSLVIGYMSDNSANQTASQNAGSMQSQYIPRILSKAYPSDFIVENGFNWYAGTETSKVYYVAFV